MSNDSNATIVAIPLEKRVSDAVVEFDQRKADLTALAQKHSGLKVSDINNNKELKAISDARKELKKERCEIQNQGKTIRSVIKELTDNVSAKEKELTGIISPVEDALEAEEKRVEDERERIKQEEARKREELIQGRVKQLIDLGCSFDGSRYSIGERSTTHINLIQMPDEAFAGIVSEYTVVSEQIEAERKEQQRIKAEAEETERQARIAEQKKLEEDRKELEKLRAEQKEREEAARKEQERIRMEQEEKERQLREEAEKMEAEKRKILQAKTNSRCNELTALGMSFSLMNDSYVFEDVNVHTTEISLSTDEDWKSIIGNITPAIAQRKEESEQRRITAEKEAEDKRLQEIESAKEQARKEEATRIEADNKRKEEERQAQEAEAKRQAALAPDKDKLISFADGLSKLGVPTVESEAAKKIVEDVKALLAKIQNHIHQKVKAL